MNGLDLFSGIGGISLALAPWVRPIAYCEQDRYAQAVLLSRQGSGDLPTAPIWDDVRTLSKDLLPRRVDIIYGGFPCQDISVAGNGRGLAGERSGLFFEIMRLVKEIKPSFIFLENVPAIRTNGLETVIRELSGAGYDCRWTMLSAREIGAPHIRQRWFCLAHSPMQGKFRETRDLVSENATSSRPKVSFEEKTGQPFNADWWETEPKLVRVANGIPQQMDRIKCLGNAVVPMQARKAFQELMGL